MNFNFFLLVPLTDCLVDGVNVCALHSIDHVNEIVAVYDVHLMQYCVLDHEWQKLRTMRVTFDLMQRLMIAVIDVILFSNEKQKKNKFDIEFKLLLLFFNIPGREFTKLVGNAEFK